MLAHVQGEAPPAEPLFLAASPEEAEALCLRGLNAIDGTKDRSSIEVFRYGRRPVILTPQARFAAYSGAAVFHAAGCQVEAMPPGADIDLVDPLSLPRERLFNVADPAVLSELESSLPQRAAALAHIDRKPLNWSALADSTPPARDWAIDHWLGMGHVTLLAGKGGVGKSLLAQQIGAALAIGRVFIDAVPEPRTVLFWSAEDEHDELWRRQVAIAAHLEAPLVEFAGQFIVESMAGRDCTMAAAMHGEFLFTALIEELRTQANDYKADVVILDNASHFFGGVENDRHQVTAFISALTGATAERHAAVLLVSHIGRATGSEYSGSSAWENACRARLWFSDRLPDQQPDDSAEPSSEVRYLARRKANYTGQDVRTMRYERGVFVPEAGEPTGGGLTDHARRLKGERVVLDAFRRLKAMGLLPTDGGTSENSLPKLIIGHTLGEGLTKRELGDAMRRLMNDGKLVRGVVGAYANRVPRHGLKEA